MVHVNGSSHFLLATACSLRENFGGIAGPGQLIASPVNHICMSWEIYIAGPSPALPAWDRGPASFAETAERKAVLVCLLTFGFEEQ